MHPCDCDCCKKDHNAPASPLFSSACGTRLSTDSGTDPTHWDADLTSCRWDADSETSADHDTSSTKEPPLLFISMFDEHSPGNHALRVLDLRLKVPEGHCPPPKDPEDEKLRARVVVRRGVANLWLGEYQRAEESFHSALHDCEYDDALTAEERRSLQEDLERVLFV